MRSRALCSFALYGPTIDRGPSSDLYVELVFLHFFFFLFGYGENFSLKHTQL